MDALRAGESGLVVLNRTPFYAEAGGQVGDTGWLRDDAALFDVSDTQRHGQAEVHMGRLKKGQLKPGDRLRAQVDAERRWHTMRNHTGTHLVHAALRAVLGKHVQQKGSLVAPGRLRFDFSHYEPVRPDQVREIERLVNHWILRNDDVQAEIMSFDDAIDAGAIAFFDEKYGDLVRVLTVGDYSKELCGGTHVRRSGDIGLFKILSETGVAAGIRRIECLTGAGALEWLAGVDERMHRMARLTRSEPESLDERLGQLLERNRELEKHVEQLKQRLAASQGDDLAARAVDVDGLKVLAAKLEGADAKSLRNTVDQLKSKLGSAVVVLAAVNENKVNLVAGVTRKDTDRIAASTLANFVAEKVGGRGGGRPDMAQAGGSDPSRIDEALDAVPGWVREHLRARTGN